MTLREAVKEMNAAVADKLLAEVLRHVAAETAADTAALAKIGGAE